MGKKCKCMHLSALALGLSLGIVSGICMMLFAWLSWKWGMGADMMRLYGSMLPRYEASMVGGLFGLGWGFIEGLITGLLIGWIYNLCLCCYRCCCCCCKSPESSDVKPKTW